MTGRYSDVAPVLGWGDADGSWPVVCDDETMMRRWIVAVGLVVSATTAGGAAIATTAPPDGPGAETTPSPDVYVTPERLADLEAAGLGALIGGDYPAQPDGVPWPTEAWPLGVMPDGVDVASLQAVLDDAFAPGAAIDAVVAIQGGRLVLQRYREGTDPFAPHISWSMAKSITQAMIGILVAEGRLDIWAPAPVPEWADPADPRHAITIDNLLHMRSGLEWDEVYRGNSDVVTILTEPDRAAFAAAKPLEFEPGTVWEYSTGSSEILSRIISDQVGFGSEVEAWAEASLFGPIGVTDVDYTLDETGAMSGGSGINMSAQDFARFGYLYLRGGTWDGRQIVPTEWVDYGRLPLADVPEYGAHWWVDGSDDAWIDRFPRMIRADGFNGQFIFVVPELDAVFVILANDVTDLPDRTAYGLIEAFAGIAPA
jgi:CubicO group peptidase (beta-lactamase class C family)